MKKTVQPVGVKGAEYRRQWNKLNRERLRDLQRAWYRANPEKRKKIPRHVTERYRKTRRSKDKPRYYAGWEQAKNRNTRWTQEETETLFRFQGTDRELSTALGRSVAAIQKRRHRLKSDEVPL